MDAEEFEFFKLSYRWGWQGGWFGWRRLLSFAVMTDLGTPVVGVVFFGLYLSYGKNKLRITNLFATN